MVNDDDDDDDDVLDGMQRLCSRGSLFALLCRFCNQHKPPPDMILPARRLLLSPGKEEHYAGHVRYRDGNK